MPIPTTFLDTCRARVLLTAEYAADVAATFALGSGAGTVESAVNLRTSTSGACPATVYSALTEIGRAHV